MRKPTISWHTCSSCSRPGGSDLVAPVLARPIFKLQGRQCTIMGNRIAKTQLVGGLVLYGNGVLAEIVQRWAEQHATLPLTRMRRVLDLSRAHTAQMAFSKLSAASSLPDLPPKPVHSHSRFVFPKREFGKKQVVKQSCQASWFSTWPWLHYQANDLDDVIFCLVCVSALKSKKMEQSRGDLAFT